MRIPARVPHNSLSLSLSLSLSYRLIGAVLVAETEISSLDKVEVREDAVEEILARRPLVLHLLDQLLLVQQQDLHVERLSAPAHAGKATHCALVGALKWKNSIL